MTDNPEAEAMQLVQQFVDACTARCEEEYRIGSKQDPRSTKTRMTWGELQRNEHDAKCRLRQFVLDVVRGHG
jgi:inhibitor of KinA sporulation pathway (predicted exonuclease)